MADFLGGPTIGGPTIGGPTNGGPTKNVVLSDSYADSLYAEALTRHRGGIIDTSPAASEVQWTLGDDSIKPKRLLRWDPWVRSYLAAYECTRYLDFAPTERLDGQPSCSLQVRLEPDKPAVKLFQMTRPKSEVYEKQVRLVLDYAELRNERTAEILTQIPNQTPFWGSLLPYHTDRMRHTAELLDVAIEMAVTVEMRFKHELAAFRPSDYSWLVQPMITTPGHGSTPSGHCTQSYVTLTVLKALLNTGRTVAAAKQRVNIQMERTAARIATNRVVAGLHFPIDNIAGRLLGIVLGEYFVYRCKKVAAGRQPYAWHEGGFDGLKFERPDEDFNPVLQPLLPDKKRPSYYTYKEPTDKVAPPDSLLQTLWGEAVKELKSLEESFAP